MIEKLLSALDLAKATANLEWAYRDATDLCHDITDCPKCMHLRPYHDRVEEAKARVLKAWL